MADRVITVKARDGVGLPCGVWEAGGDVVLYLHGIESHMGWFEDMADDLRKKGFCIYALDRRGSGLSAEERGHIGSYRILINDIYDVIGYIRNIHPEKKVYLMGVCGGGKFAACFAGFYPGFIDGLILISPAIKTKISLPLGDKIDALFNSFLRPLKKIPTPLRDDMFTKNERYIHFIKNDRLSLHYLTARFYREMALMELRLSGRIYKVDIPVLTLLAEDDPIVDNSAMERWHRRLRTRRKAIRLFSGCCHFLPFQEKREEIVDYITHWILNNKTI